MKEIEIKAYGKINLFLDVLGKRSDGYHYVQMIMQSISLADTVLVRTSVAGPGISSNREKSIPLNQDNIALKAWLLMQRLYHLPGSVEIDLHKEIPVGAGLAGGSTDAAAVLKAVNILYNLALTNEELAQIGEQLGADVPFCITGGTVLAEGIGEVLTPLPKVPQMWLVLVNPGFEVSTAQVYRHLDLTALSRHGNISGMIDAIGKGDFNKICTGMENVLENVTIKMHPVLFDIKKELAALGLYPLMSGSGPTVFGVAETKEKALWAAEKLQGKWETVITAYTV
ncbi:MAG: 4-(cytidine 5'-diphospho)-2-C-methyl-D-erythritol kinase [Bacillota bacterium]